MRISDWSSDVCSSDLLAALNRPQLGLERYRHHLSLLTRDIAELAGRQGAADSLEQRLAVLNAVLVERYGYRGDGRSEEHTSELQSLMRISYAVFCVKKKKQRTVKRQPETRQDEK